jgi:hypothetical protein
MLSPLLPTSDAGLKLGEEPRFFLSKHLLNVGHNSPFHLIPSTLSNPLEENIPQTVITASARNG